jgi:DNA-binding CsgD family transcriptional regulator
MPVARTFIGRRDERDQLGRRLDDAMRGRGGALAVLGDAGIGKSALIDVIAAERQDSMRVIRLTGVEVESDLAYAGLATLVAQSGDALGRLDDAVADVLRGAIGIGDRTPAGLDVHLATLALLGTLGAQRPVLVLADDIQWIDGASLAIIAFVARRVGNDPVALLLAGRPTPEVVPLVRGIEQLELPPLPIDDGETLLVEHGFDPVVARRCWTATGGNPLALVELAKLLDADQRAGRAPLPYPIPVAGPIREVFAVRLATIDRSARQALAIAAVDATGDAAVIARALDRAQLDAADLRAAESAGLITSVGATVEWEHPLARAAVLDALDPPSRREAHRAVAAALDESTDGARVVFHLAAAAEGPDEAIAERLDDVARRATERGAGRAAAVAWEVASALSVDDDVRFERVHAGMTARWSAGESENVVRSGRPVVEATVDPHRRARLALMVGQAVVWWEGPIAGARYLTAEGDRIAELDPVAAGLLYVYAANAHLVALDPDAVIELAARTGRIATEAGDLGLPLMSAAMEGLGRLIVGDTVEGQAKLDPLGQLCPALLSGHVDGAAPMSQVVAFAQITSEQWSEARDLLAALIAEAERTGYIGMQSYAHDQLGDMEWRQGRWAEAASRVAHTLTLAEGHDQPIVHQGHLRQARLDACRGRTEPARAAATAALEVGQRIGLRTLVFWAREALALAALADDDRADALRHLDAMAVLMTERGIHHPGLVWWQALHIETLVDEGRTADAIGALARLRADTELVGGSWPRSAVARGEAALAADPAVAIARLDDAAALLTELGATFELAQVLLRRGAWHQRARNGVEAGHDLAEARSRFEHLDARPWVDRAARLADPSVPGPAPSLASILTDGEMRVALAVGSGLTNRAAADQLYLSVKTVDSHLQSIYRRLEIRSRSQLAALVARELGPVSV